MSLLPQDPASKIAIAKEKKELADKAFKAGDLQAALLNYHEAMMYLHGLDKNMLSAISGNASSSPGLSSVPPEEVGESIETPGIEKAKDAEKNEAANEVDDLLGKIYSNQSACHMKRGNWKRAVETAEKALAKNPSNHKAQFRKGKAQAEQGYVEKALATLEDLLAKDGTDKAAINAEIVRIKAVDREREKKHNQKFKGFLNKKPAINPYDSTPSASSATSFASTDSTASAASKASSAGTVPSSHTATGLTPQMTKATLDGKEKDKEEAPKTLEPSGLVEVSEEEFERAKKARG